jgi:hypothetical protein
MLMTKLSCDKILPYKEIKYFWISDIFICCNLFQILKQISIILVQILLISAKGDHIEQSVMYKEERDVGDFFQSSRSNAREIC